MEPNFPPSPKSDQPDNPEGHVGQPVPIGTQNTIISPQQPLSPPPSSSTQPQQPQAQSLPATPFFSSDPVAFGSTQAIGRRSRKKLFVGIIGVLAGLLLLGGGVAVAYFALILPNNPENVLKQAVVNTAKEKEVTVDGKFDMKAADASKDAAMPAIKATYRGGFNTAEKTGEVTLKTTMSGIDFPVDIRYVDGNAYIKVGDLNTVLSLISGYAASALMFDRAELDPMLQNVSNLLSNQWIAFDSTLLDEAGVSCITDANFAVTDQDIELLSSSFGNHSFAEIDSHRNDMVGDRMAIKYELSLDDNKMAKFIEDKKLKNLSFIKTIEKCPAVEEAPSTNWLADNDTTPLTLWVDKDTKRIVKIASHSTKQDAEKENVEASLEAVVSYGKVSVTKPENAKPAMQLLAELQKEFNTVFGQSSDVLLPSDDVQADDTGAFLGQYLTQ